LEALIRRFLKYARRRRRGIARRVYRGEIVVSRTDSHASHDLFRLVPGVIASWSYTVGLIIISRCVASII
jgi:hypothetical protein